MDSVGSENENLNGELIRLDLELGPPEALLPLHHQPIGLQAPDSQPPHMQARLGGPEGPTGSDQILAFCVIEGRTMWDLFEGGYVQGVRL